LLVCDQTLDDCLGYIRSRALVDRLLEQAPLELSSLIREPLRVSPEHKTLELMARFRRARPHLALVTDEYGTTLGLVTPADVMESIAGQLPNGFVARPRVSPRDRDSWVVDARIELHDLERALRAGAFPTKHPFITLAGFILENLENIPAGGEVVIVNGWRLEVMDVDDKRIDSVLVSRLPDVPRVLKTAQAAVRAAGGESGDDRGTRASAEVQC
jgi:putative hemolysin